MLQQPQHWADLETDLSRSGFREVLTHLREVLPSTCCLAADGDCEGSMELRRFAKGQSWRAFIICSSCETALELAD